MYSDRAPRMTLLWLCLFWACGTVAWFHLGSIPHMIDDASFLIFRHDPTQQTHPAMHRMLIPLVYSLVPGSLKALTFGMNPPIESFGSIFQLLVDTAALFVSFFFFWRAIAAGGPKTMPAAEPIIVAWLVFFYIVTTSYIVVPNRAQYFPYDFVDIAFFSIVLWMAADHGRSHIVGLPLIIFAATLNKETGIFFVLVFFAIRMTQADHPVGPLFGRKSLQIVAVTVLAGVVGIIGKYVAVRLSHYMSGEAVAPALFYNQLAENIRQLRNPLFWFVFLGMFGFAWVVPLVTRRPFSRRLLAVYALALLWIALIFVAGISRGLRVYGPMGLLIAWAVLGPYLARRSEDRASTSVS